ncbi:MAG: tRNA preQ1(34) S-adenosylmethionine ribosyltransferase-isomerase QueA [Archangiaceae bacterium]|nr:tRNA preQ1(34) S-adenosylmethionine ribosyltransferase-isomerase QueA [Archangiaceae bacterium]
MQIEECDSPLPEELIAQRALDRRDASRLMQVDRESGAVTHRTFSELPTLLGPGDLLVVNDTRVIPARLFGQKQGTGGKVELLLVRPEGQAWACLGQAAKALKLGTVVEVAGGLTATIAEVRGGGEYLVQFDGDPTRHGELPLPPYITRPADPADAERYQTVFASVPGSVAAPTAGLHFTPEVLEALAARGVKRATVTLDVGPGTFLPVRDGDIAGHKMHSERCVLPMETYDAIQDARRVIAVGTTVVRTLETFAAAGIKCGELDTRLFIRPGYEFQVVDGLLTNFHLPRSTLLMLVAAFMGREKMLAAYAQAVAQRYRFFSYGDAMFIG